jgi:hypothetical protein
MKRTCPAYWSMSLGEGFDLPMLEAAACDLQLIAPRHSSYLHYLQPEHAFLLPVEVVNAEIPDDHGLSAFFRGGQWWRPDESAAAQTLRSIIDDTYLPRQSARKILINTCNWGRMADRLIQLVDEHRGQLHGKKRAS